MSDGNKIVRDVYIFLKVTIMLKNSTKKTRKHMKYLNTIY